MAVKPVVKPRPKPVDRNQKLKECQRIIKQIELEIKLGKFTVDTYAVYFQQLESRFRTMSAVPSEKVHISKLKERLNTLITQAREQKLI